MTSTPGVLLRRMTQPAIMYSSRREMGIVEETVRLTVGRLRQVGPVDIVLKSVALPEERMSGWEEPCYAELLVSLNPGYEAAKKARMDRGQWNDVDWREACLRAEEEVLIIHGQLRGALLRMESIIKREPDPEL